MSEVFNITMFPLPVFYYDIWVLCISSSIRKIEMSGASHMHDQANSDHLFRGVCGVKAVMTEGFWIADLI